MPSHHNQKGRSKKRGQYVPITHNMARSDAWRSLSGAATKVYIELRARHNGYNNGDISLSYREASDLLTIGKSSVAIQVLRDELRSQVDPDRPGIAQLGTDPFQRVHNILAAIGAPHVDRRNIAGKGIDVSVR